MTITKDQLIENSMLIAEFMGFTPVEGAVETKNIICLDTQEHFVYRDNYYNSFATGNSPDKLLFYKSFDWLMPVVEKIESLQMDSINGSLILESIGNCAKFIIDDGTRMFSDNIGESKLEAIYLSVIEFINWYNEKK